VPTDTRPKPLPVLPIAETTNASPENPTLEPVEGWPSWAAAALAASGLVIIVLETTSLLFFAGLALVGIGIYGFVAGVHTRGAWSRPHRRPVLAS
jgi:hypothetical protein